MTIRLSACADVGVLVEPGADRVLALDAALRAALAAGQAPAGVLDTVPGQASLLVVLDPARTDVTRVAAWVRATRPHPPPRSGAGGQVTLDVRYDGEDLEEVGRLAGLTAAEVVAAHSGSPWRVAFVGFAPGFGYLVGGDPRLLAVPRRDSPRVRVPAGSVALAGGYSAVYPGASPGGWQLLGRTAAVLFDVHRDPPALLRPGDTVHFRAVGP